MWLTDQIRQAAQRYDVVLVTPHWGPNMTTEPPAHVRRAADAFVEAGATVVAGHSAHIFHGVNGRIIYDLGDLIDDYVRDTTLRNDLGLLWLVTLDDTEVNIEAIPLHLTFAHTDPANATERKWIKTRLASACTEFGTVVAERDNLFTTRTEQNAG